MQGKNETRQINQEQRSLEEVVQQLQLHPDLIRGIYANYLSGSIEPQALLAIIDGKNIIIDSTQSLDHFMMLSVAALQLIDCYSPYCQALALTSTRQSAISLNRYISQVGRFLKANTRCCIGGTSVREDRDALRNGGIHLIAGTPGRTLDLINRKMFNPQTIKTVFIFQVDSVLSRGFRQQLEQIIQHLQTSVQICAFGDLLTLDFEEILGRYMQPYLKVKMKTLQEQGLYKMKYFYTQITDEEKFPTFLQLHKNNNLKKCVLLLRDRSRAQELIERLRKQNCNVFCNYWEMSSRDHQKLMTQLGEKSTGVLVCTNIPKIKLEIDAIVNYDMAYNLRGFVNQIGWQGRLGEKRIVISFITDYDSNFRSGFKRVYDIEMQKLSEKSLNSLS